MRGEQRLGGWIVEALLQTMALAEDHSRARSSRGGLADIDIDVSLQ
jgi:hypothetical protein